MISLRNPLSATQAAMGLIAVVSALFFLGPGYWHETVAAETIDTLDYTRPQTVETAHGEDEDAIISTYFSIQCDADVNLKTVNRSLRGSSGFFGSGDHKLRSLDTVEEKIAYKLDALFRKVKDILNMHPRTERIHIRIFKRQRDLRNEHNKIFGGGFDDNLLSFYAYKHNTIYTTEEDISDTIIAHEMGHAVIDHYFVVRLPENIAELLAGYVESHL